MNSKLIEINGLGRLKGCLQGAIFYGFLAFSVTVMADETRISYIDDDGNTQTLTIYVSSSDAATAVFFLR